MAGEQMIHVDVRKVERPGIVGQSEQRFEFHIATSVDGAAFSTRWITNERTRAETIGRVFASGCAFARGSSERVKLTMFGGGESLYGPAYASPTPPPVSEN